MKKYIKLEGKSQELKVQVFYAKGGMNYFNYKTEPRGYWVSIQPVNVDRNENGVVWESFDMFSGYKVFLLEVKRKSDKAYKQAIELAESKIPEMVERVKGSAV